MRRWAAARVENEELVLFDWRLGLSHEGGMLRRGRRNVMFRGPDGRLVPSKFLFSFVAVFFDRQASQVFLHRLLSLKDNFGRVRRLGGRRQRVGRR